MNYAPGPIVEACIVLVIDLREALEHLVKGPVFLEETTNLAKHRKTGKLHYLT